MLALQICKRNKKGDTVRYAFFVLLVCFIVVFCSIETRRCVFVTDLYFPVIVGDKYFAQFKNISVVEYFVFAHIVSENV